MITATLPYPISANVYWRSRIIRTKIRSFVSTYVSPEAVQYKATVGTIFRAAGIQMIPGRIKIEYDLSPRRPLDAEKRASKDPDYWDDSVQCLDLDNVSKVLLDSLKGIAFGDDKQVFEIHARRMQPAERAHVTVRIYQLNQPSLLEEQR